MSTSVPDAERVEPHYRVNAAAEIAGVSRSTVFRLIREGKLKSKRLSARLTLIPKSALQQLLDDPS